MTDVAAHPESATGERVLVDVGPLSIDDVVMVARGSAPVELSAAARDAMATSRRSVDAHASSPTPAYGVSTGFGALATRHIPPELRSQLQKSLVRSHAAGAGDEVEREVVRALILLRLSTLATGRTGARVETALAIAGLLNHGVSPLVFEYGSLGCSGDLAPLAHCALVLMGEGEVRTSDGRRSTAAEALRGVGQQPIRLAEKEGLALINGTDGMLGMLALAVHDLRMLLRTADIGAAMSVEGLLATDRVFAADLQALRPHPGQARSADNLRRLLAGSPIMASHRGPNCHRVQDAYSLRCSPQVNGAARDAVAYAAEVAERELAAAIDNPVVLPDGRIESNGNFHGAPIAYVLDFLAIPVADVASMAERRTDRFLDPARNGGLPPFLAGDPGVDSGLMIAQYTQAAVVSDLKRLAVPASVDSIPSSAMQEDHVSMGWSAARKLRRAVDGLARVLAIEVLTAARGIDLRCSPAAAQGADTSRTLKSHEADEWASAVGRGLSPAPGTAAVVAALRTEVDGPGADRYLAPDIAAAYRLVRSGALVKAAESVIGPLS
jgi:histidine ammonia-lyase